MSKAPPFARVPREPWSDLPIVFGEEDPNYGRLYAKYSHVGCPGCQYEDNCPAPRDCATKGRCRIIYQAEGA
jgi:hypothetical protein